MEWKILNADKVRKRKRRTRVRMRRTREIRLKVRKDVRRKEVCQNEGWKKIPDNNREAEKVKR